MVVQEASDGTVKYLFELPDKKYDRDRTNETRIRLVRLRDHTSRM